MQILNWMIRLIKKFNLIFKHFTNVLWHLILFSLNTYYIIAYMDISRDYFFSFIIVTLKSPEMMMMNEWWMRNMIKRIELMGGVIKCARYFKTVSFFFFLFWKWGNYFKKKFNFFFFFNPVEISINVFFF